MGGPSPRFRRSALPRGDRRGHDRRRVPGRGRRAARRHVPRGPRPCDRNRDLGRSFGPWPSRRSRPSPGGGALESEEPPPRTTPPRSRRPTTSACDPSPRSGRASRSRSGSRRTRPRGDSSSSAAGGDVSLIDPADRREDGASWWGRITSISPRARTRTSRCRSTLGRQCADHAAGTLCLGLAFDREGRLYVVANVQVPGAIYINRVDLYRTPPLGADGSPGNADALDAVRLSLRRRGLQPRRLPDRARAGRVDLSRQRLADRPRRGGRRPEDQPTGRGPSSRRARRPRSARRRVHRVHPPVRPGPRPAGPRGLLARQPQPVRVRLGRPGPPASTPSTARWPTTPRNSTSSSGGSTTASPTSSATARRRPTTTPRPPPGLTFTRPIKNLGPAGLLGINPDVQPGAALRARGAGLLPRRASSPSATTTASSWRGSATSSATTGSASTC